MPARELDTAGSNGAGGSLVVELTLFSPYESEGNYV